jgi:hypothetical protein
MQTLSRINAERLVVGHTPQLSGANCECDGRVWRIDVGMSGGVLNSPVQVNDYGLLPYARLFVRFVCLSGQYSLVLIMGTSGGLLLNHLCR